MDTTTISQIKHVFGLSMFSWVSYFAVTSFIGNLILLRLLLKKHKALELLTFSYGKLGVQLSYTLNKDKQLLLVSEDNILLSKQIEILTKENEILKGEKKKRKEYWAFVMMAFPLFILWVLYVYDKLIFKKQDLTDIDKTTGLPTNKNSN